MKSFSGIFGVTLGERGKKPTGLISFVEGDRLLYNGLMFKNIINENGCVAGVARRVDSDQDECIHIPRKEPFAIFPVRSSRLTS